MKRVFEIVQECQSCGGTGLYIGMAERDGAAVVCHTCRGSGKSHFVHEYENFTGKKPSAGVKQVYATNPGIGIGTGKNGEYKLSDFGGISYQEWVDGKKFGPGTENRAFTCPAWWYQSADSKKKPEWKECGWGQFSSCSSFKNKSKCWERWDKEFGGKK